jgi:hypothetical protein
MSQFNGTSWSEPESIRCAYQDGEASYVAQSPDLSQDSFDRPVIVWSAYSSVTGRDVICVSCPTDSGYPIAEELPIINDGFLASSARDENGDVWLAWWKYFDGAFWIHSHTAVDVKDAVVEGSPSMRRIAWTLTGPAPGSWWSILRAEPESTYVVVGRVQAGAAPIVEWIDTTTTDHPYLYRIRRDCKDTRYETLTEPILSVLDVLSWLPLSLRVEGSNPVRGIARVRVIGAAAGSVSVDVFDVRGRRVGLVHGVAGPEGDVTFDLGTGGSSLGMRGAGLYFARAQDSRGRISPTLKLVHL